MPIDKSGKWWRGSSVADLEEYLAGFTSDTYQAKYFRASRCKCGGSEFSLEVDADEEAARRTCRSCKEVTYICDSEVYWADPPSRKYRCIECRTIGCNIGVGFATYEESPADIKWLYIGVRCAKCGILGCIADWKVGQSDALGLLEKV